MPTFIKTNPVLIPHSFEPGVTGYNEKFHLSEVKIYLRTLPNAVPDFSFRARLFVGFYANQRSTVTYCSYSLGKWCINLNAVQSFSSEKLSGMHVAYAKNWVVKNEWAQIPHVGVMSDVLEEMGLPKAIRVANSIRKGDYTL